MDNLSYDILEIIFEWLQLENKMNLFKSGLIDSSFIHLIGKIKNKYILRQHGIYEDSVMRHRQVYIGNTYIIDGYDALVKNISKLHDVFHQKYKDNHEYFLKFCDKCSAKIELEIEIYIDPCNNCFHLSDIKYESSTPIGTYIESISCENNPNTLVCDKCIFCKNCDECITYMKISQQLDFEFKFKKCKNRICCDECKKKITLISCDGLLRTNMVYFNTRVDLIEPMPDSDGILFKI
jgi:hypothetical protein